MKYGTHRTKISETEIRYRNVLESDECPNNGPISIHFQRELVHQLANNPQFLMCGPVPFKTMKMWHNGNHWVIELESLHKE